MQFFERLGAMIEQRWKDHNYDEVEFPDVSAEALVETNPSALVDPLDIIRWVHNSPQLPAQQDIDARFGNPPVTLYAGPRFYIDAYYWLDGTTSIHQHSFSGAFQVLTGSSIHSRYDFQVDEEINAHLVVGNAAMRKVELLRQGDVRKIRPGTEFIHALFHLERPSVTITVRTYHTPKGAPQFSYLKPFIGFDPFFKEQSSIRKVQTAVLLLKMEHSEADKIIGDLILSSDFHTVFAVLEAAFHQLTSDELERVFHLSTGRERFAELLDKARIRHGQLVELLPPVFDELQRQANIAQRRSYLKDTDQRFLLALILNVPDRSRVLALVKQRFPDRDAIDTIADWLRDLGTTKMLGSPEPNVLGVEDFDDDCLFVIRGLLQGRSQEQISRDTVEQYSAERASQLNADMAQIIDSLRASILLRPLL